MPQNRMTDRDRDVEGRAQNQRPRDAYGRPLPHGSPQGAPVIPEDAEYTPAEGLARAQELLDEGYAFTAHEVLEAVWKSAASTERELWQGLAQVAVGLTHVQRQNLTGAVRLLRRGAQRVAAFADEVGGPVPHGVATADVAAYALHLADEVEAGRRTTVDPAQLRLRADN
ncbi:DUF309 domain-containing protein [Lipingzhangella sp. LS1_29]|uniref:DUF309 domain-containing protein n=1 Tax=Lipingzhangella rawalii TaxID=2055835 RepID=A0ABU2H3Z7_9ACTN|nr:DUF309 domain-containing protein [Lipingzhangella rawalii]MDS1270028.1 DUF309 domain-containing protein [Lipingzhangella rawalii]